VVSHLRNNVIGYVALFFALSAGAYAVTDAPTDSVGSKSVRDGSLKGIDIRDNRIKGIDVDESTLDLSAATVLDAERLDGADASAYIGPRAYGRVAANGDLSRSKGVAGVGNPSPGVFCLSLTDLDPATSPIIVSGDFAGDGTNFDELTTPQSSATQEWDSSGADCPAGQYEVLTGVLYEIVEANGGPDLQHVNGSFAFIVP
jgi:hypothetical protein